MPDRDEIFEETQDAKDAQVLMPVPGSALEQFERADIDIQIATAKKYPRASLEVIRRDMETFALADQETAEECFYTLERENKSTGEKKLIQGASVALARIAVGCYQNLWAGSRTISNDGKMVTAQGMCWDLEKNVRIFRESSRSIVGKFGRPYSLDMQIVTANAAGAIAYRNAVWDVIPFPVWKPVFERAMQFAAGEDRELAERVQKALKWFAFKGVTHERLLRAIEKNSIDEITRQDLIDLQGLATAIKDSLMTVDEAFPAKREAEAPEGRSSHWREMLRERRKKREDQAAPAPEPEKQS